MDTTEKLELLKKWHERRRDAYFTMYPVLGSRGAEGGWGLRLVKHKKVFTGTLDHVLDQAIEFLTIY